LEPVTVIRWAIVVASAAGMILGVAPGLLILGRPTWLLIAVGVAMVFSLLGIVFGFSTETKASSEPTRGEFVLAGLATAWSGALIAVVMGVLYFVGYFFGWLFNLGGGHFQWALHATPSAWGFFLSGVLGGVVCGAILTLVTPTMIRMQLYPEAAGLPTAFEQFRGNHLAWAWAWIKSGWFWLALLGYAGLVWLLSITLPGFAWTAPVMACIVLWIVIFEFAFVYFNATAPAVEQAVEQTVNVGDTLQQACENAGWRVVKPHTLDESADRLLKPLDFIAVDRERAVGVAVRTASANPPPLGWSELLQISMAGQAARTWSDKLELPSSQVGVCLALIDRPIDDFALEMAAEQQVQIVTMSSKDLSGPAGAEVLLEALKAAERESSSAPLQRTSVP
jgi:hypothetical protein